MSNPAAGERKWKLTLMTLTQEELNGFVIAGAPFMATITGKLKASIQFKRRGGLSIGNMIAENMAWDLLRAGRMSSAKYKSFFYPPTYYLTVPALAHGWRRVAEDGTVSYVLRQPVDGDPNKQRRFIWSFVGRPIEFDPIAHNKATVTVRARMVPWENGLGAKVTRPKILEIVPVERVVDERSDAEVMAGTMDKINEVVEDVTGERITLGVGR